VPPPIAIQESYAVDENTWRVVGAETSTSRRAAISGHPSACGSVGSPKRRSNQRRTSGWNVSSTVRYP